MVDSNTDSPDSSIVSSSSNTSTIPQLPIEVVGLILQFLSTKERVKVQRVSKSWRDYSRGTVSLWKNSTYFSDDFIKPDICKDVQALSLTKQWTNMKFSRFGISAQSKKKEQTKAFKKILDWLPNMEVQDLLISSDPVGDRDLVDPINEFEWEPNHSFDDLPGFEFLQEEEAQRLVGILQAIVTAGADAETFRSLLEDALDSIEMAMAMAQDKAITNCSCLRSLLLDSPFAIPCTISQNDPIAQCKLNILSIRNDDYDYRLDLQALRAICSMVKEARVLDLIRSCDNEMTIQLILAASQSLEYLTFDIDIPVEDADDDTSILNLPRLKHLHFLTTPINLKIDCPNLESLHLKHLRDIHYFSSIPSVKTLFIEEGYSFKDEIVWELLVKIGADRLETFLIYSHSLTLRSFVRFFSNAKGLPRLRELVVLTCGEMSKDLLDLDKLCEYSSKELQNIRKVDKLIWQCNESNEPALSTQAFIREHFATKLECIKAPALSLEYSAEIMGNFVKHKSLVDKLLFFDKFLWTNSRD